MNTDLTGGYYRRIYAGYLTGKRINSVSMEAEAWFWRLHAIADDFGNLHGDTQLLVSLASPRRFVTTKQVAKWNLELTKAGLIIAYWAKMEAYFHIQGFESKQPAGKNGKRIQKCPAFTWNAVSVNPGESKKIQVNPGESSAVREIQTDHTQDHYHNHNETTLPESAGAAPARKAKPRSEKQIERDVLWDAVKASFFPSGTSKADDSLIGKTVTALRAKNALPEEIPKRLARWPTLYPDAGPLTPVGLAKHWDALGTAKEIKPFEFVAPEAW